jgi:predicted nucleotidyltransferase
MTALGFAYTGPVAVPDNIVQALQAVATSHEHVRALYAFGSRVTDSARPDSDLDVGVLLTAPESLEATLLLEDALERATGLRVDLVDVARAGAFVALEIVQGERIFTRHPVETDEFELYVLRRAGDLLPFERARRTMLLTPSS